jgi:hypothetical protein
MFYSASTALMQLQAYEAERANADRHSPAAGASGFRWPRLLSRLRETKPASAAARESTSLQTLSAWQQTPEPGC